MKLKIKFTSDLARQIYEKREKPLAWNTGDSCMDMSYVGEAPIVLAPGVTKIFPTGLHIQITGTDSDNYGTMMRGRSGLNSKGILVVVGTIDFGYTGEYGVVLYNSTAEPFTVNPGDRTAQLAVERIFKPEIEFVDELDETNRGANAWGSSGK